MQSGMSRINGDMFFFFLIMIPFWLCILPLQYKLCWQWIKRARYISHCVVQFFLCRICIKLLHSSLGFCVRQFRVAFLYSLISISQELHIKFWLVFEIRSCLWYFLTVMLKMKGLPVMRFHLQEWLFLIFFSLLCFLFSSSKTYEWTVHRMVFYI